MDTKSQHDITRKLKVLNYALTHKNVAKTFLHLSIGRATFYRWKTAYFVKGELGLIDNRYCSDNLTLRVPKEFEEKIIHLSTTYHFGPLKISWCLKKFLDVNVSRTGCYGVLKRNGLSRLPENCRKCSMPSFIRYEKKVPGHHLQVDVKFLFFVDESGQRIKRFQYTAIDDSTRIRALKIYEKHTQANAMDIINYVVEKFPFRIKMNRTDNGHEFQSKFDWHVLDLGMEHAYIKPGTPRLNGKV